MITAQSDDRNYCTRLTNAAAEVYADVARSNGGGGGHFDPFDLVCAGYAACLNITARMILDRMHLAYEKVLTKVAVDTAGERTTVFSYHVEIVGAIDEATKAAVIAKLAKCPVQKALAGTVIFQPMREGGI
jgi:putative redox protein